MSEELDERLKLDPDDPLWSTPRSSKEPGAGRRSREMDDRSVVESREVSEDDRLEMFRQSLFNDALPDIPPIPGYHVCWLTTTNPRDSIHRRMQLGYEPIKAHDIPGMEFSSLKTGDWAGCIGVNEMIAFKLPMSLYQKFMQEAHHDAPRREEEMLTAQSDQLRQDLESHGAAVYEGDGLTELRRGRSATGQFGD